MPVDQAATHFESALPFCRKAGCRPELAWGCCDYADMLLERHGDGDRAKAVSLLDESLVIAIELGMRRLTERVNERLREDDDRPEIAPTYPDGLTQREVDVLRLAAAGKADLEIAVELVITLNTVTSYVATSWPRPEPPTGPRRPHMPPDTA